MIILTGGFASATQGGAVNRTRFQESTSAVYISYNKSKGIYKKAHRACRKFFDKNMITDSEGRVSYSVEILTIVPKIKKASALCVARRYKNDDVLAVNTRF